VVAGFVIAAIAVMGAQRRGKANSSEKKMTTDRAAGRCSTREQKLVVIT
jgi:hypothetical protein